MFKCQHKDEPFHVVDFFKFVPYIDTAVSLLRPLDIRLVHYEDLFSVWNSYLICIVIVALQLIHYQNPFLSVPMVFLIENIFYFKKETD